MTLRSIETRQTITLPEFGQAMGIPRSTVYALARAGRLPVPVRKIGRRLLIPKAALERFLATDDGADHIDLAAHPNSIDVE